MQRTPSLTPFCSFLQVYAGEFFYTVHLPCCIPIQRSSSISPTFPFSGVCRGVHLYHLPALFQVYAEDSCLSPTCQGWAEVFISITTYPFSGVCRGVYHHCHLPALFAGVCRGGGVEGGISMTCLPFLQVNAEFISMTYLPFFQVYAEFTSMTYLPFFQVYAEFTSMTYLPICRCMHRSLFL